MYAHKCEFCGAYLDPGERCDCLDEKEKESKKTQKQAIDLSKYIREGKHGQLKLVC